MRAQSGLYLPDLNPTSVDLNLIVIPAEELQHARSGHSDTVTGPEYETWLTSCDLMIFVEETAEAVMAADAGGVGLVVVWERA
jgi:hypothetical protein